MSEAWKTVYTKGTKYRESVASLYEAVIVEGKSIKVRAMKTSATSKRLEMTEPKEFKIGDFAEFDSFNFSYIGTITGIGEKTVSIHSKGRGKTFRLDIHTFAWRNYDFDLAKAEAHNAVVMMEI